MANQDFRVKNGLQVGLGASVVGIVTAESFSGSAVGLTNVPSASLTGTISSERLSGTYNIDILGTVSGATISATTATVTEQLNVGAGDTGVFATATDGTLLVTGIATFKDRVIFDSTNSIQIPVGTDAEKDAVGTAVTGQIRYNTTNSQFEGFGPGNDWGSLGGVKDVDGDTYVKPESSPGSDEDALTFFTAGTERAVIDSNGKVGIGTTNPTKALDVVGYGTSNGIRVGDTHFFAFGDANKGTKGSPTFQNLNTNSDTVLRVLPNGTGKAQFEFFATDYFANAGIGTTTWNNLRIFANNNQGEIRIDTSAATEAGVAKSISIETNVSPGGETRPNQYQLYLDINGNIGLGTNTPSSTLDVDGTLNVSGVSTFQDRVIFDSTNSIQIPVGTTADRDAVGTAVTGQIRYNTTLSSFEGYGPGGEWGTLGGVKDIDQDTYITAQKDLAVDDDALRFYTNGTEQVSIDSTGKVGIGSTQPTAKLDVSGDIVSSGNLLPLTDNTGVVGNASYTWSNGQFTNLTIDSTLNVRSAIDLADNDILRFGSSDDVKVFYDGTNNDLEIELESAATQIAITDNGTYKHIITKDGKIGVNTSVIPSSELEVYGNIKLTGAIYGSTELIIDPMPIGVGTTSGIVRIKGDLYVDGTTTQINSTSLEIADFIVGIASTATTDLLADGAGIQIGPDNTLLYQYNNGTNPSLQSSENLSVATGKVYQIGTTERLSANTLSLGTGTTIHSPSNQILTLGTGGQERVRVDSSGNVGIGTDNATSKLDVNGTLNVSGVSTFSDDLIVGTATTGVVARTDGTLNVSGVSTFQNHVHLGDSDTLYLGDGNDLRIKHDSGNSYITDSGTLLINTATNLEIANISGVSKRAIFKSDAVELYSGGNKKFETTGYGVTVTGGLNVSGVSTFSDDLNVGAGDTGVFIKSNGDIFSSGIITATTFDISNSGNLANGDYSARITARNDSSNGNVLYINPIDNPGTPASGNRLSIGINTTSDYGTNASGAADLFFVGEDNIIFGAGYPKIKIANPNAFNGKFYEINAVYSGSGPSHPDYGYIRNELTDATYSVALNGSFAFSVGDRDSSLNSNRASNFNSGKEAFVVILDGSTSLFHNKSKKLETSGVGVTVTGITQTDNLNVGTAGTVITTTSSGLVGIGSTQPTSTLDLDGTLNVSGISTFQDNVSIAGTTTGLYLDADTSGVGLALRPKIRIDTPTSLRYFDTFALDAPTVQYVRHLARDLDYNISVSNDRTFLISGGANFTTAVNTPGVNDSDIAFKIIPQSSTELRYNYIKKLETTGYGVSVYGGANVSGVSTFQDDVNIGIGGTVAFFDISSGKVGIGSTNPIYPLDVNGDVNSLYYRSRDGGEFNGQLYLNLNGTALGEGLAIRGGDSGNGGAYVRWMSDAGTTGYTGHYQGITSGTGYDYTIVTETGLGFRVHTNGNITANSDFYINPSGNVGIGSTQPTSKLDVDGGVNVSGIITASTLVSNVSTGTSPLTIASTTLVSNLNADLLDDQEGSYYLNYSNFSGIATDSDKLDGQEGSYYLNYSNFSGIATDSDKLDGQEGSYYLNYSNFVGVATDSDKLDGQEASYYLNYSNFTNTPPDVRWFETAVGIWTSSSVGIGTTNPTSTLTVDGTLNVSGASTISVNSTSDALRITQTGSGNALVVEDSTNPDATPFVVNADGRVSIGTNTSSSSWGLQLYGVGLQINNSTEGSGSFTGLMLGYQSALGVNNMLSWSKPLWINSGFSDVIIQPNDRNVGIGTTLPNNKLDVIGNTYISGNIGIGVTNPTAKLDVTGHTELDTLNVSGVSTFITSDTVNQPWPTSSGDGTAIRIKATRLSSYDSSGNGSVSSLDGSQYLAGIFPANVSIANTLGTAGINFSDGDVLREVVNATQYSGSFAIFTRNSTYAYADNYISASPNYGVQVGYSTSGNGGFFLRKTKNDGNGTPTEILKIDAGSDDLIFSGQNVGIGSASPTAKLDVNGSIAIKNHSIVSTTISHTASAGTPFTIDTFATSANDLAEYTIHVGYGTYIQAQKVLVMHDGVDAYSQEYAIMHNPSKIVSIEASISGSNVLLQATPETGISGITTYKIVRGGLV